MSHITSIMLTTFLGEDDAIRHIESAIGEKLIDFSDMDVQAVPGCGYMQMGVYLMAVNKWFPKVFIEAIQSAPWESKESVQLFVSGEHKSLFKEIDVFSVDAIAQTERIIDIYCYTDPYFTDGSLRLDKHPKMIFRTDPTKPSRKL